MRIATLASLKIGKKVRAYGYPMVIIADTLTKIGGISFIWYELKDENGAIWDLVCGNGGSMILTNDELGAEHNITGCLEAM